jgi:hypothetical protein
MIRLEIKTCSLARDNELFTVFLQADSDISAAVEGTFIIKAQDARTAGCFLMEEDNLRYSYNSRHPRH